MGCLHRGLVCWGVEVVGEGEVGVEVLVVEVVGEVVVDDKVVVVVTV